jgi:hypothetical protein
MSADDSASFLVQMFPQMIAQSIRTAKRFKKAQFLPVRRQCR